MNSGVPFAVLPGSPVGIPPHIPVLAEALRDVANYESHMVGKWHVSVAFVNNDHHSKNYFSTLLPYLFISNLVCPFLQVGYGHWRQLPVGRGFKSFTGSLDIDIDSWTKQMHVTPYDPGAIDWMTAFENGSYSHYAEARHPTEALTHEAQDIMKRHVDQRNAGDDAGGNSEERPLFLYVSYPAPHSPCQPMPQHTAPCRHVPHKWRRDFCGMMVGLGE
jgi:arylsulfatase A-like enzyme